MSLDTDRVGSEQVSPDAERIFGAARKKFRRRQWARRWLSVRWPLLAVVAAGLIALGVWLVFFSSVLVVSSVAVEGQQVLTASQVKQVARVPLGTPLARVDLGAIAERVETLPAIESAEVTRVWPDTLQISVTERTAVAVVAQNGTLWALSPDGVLFTRLTDPPQGLPQLHTAAGADRTTLREGAALVAALPQEVARRVDYVDLRSMDDITLHLKNGDLVRWGSASETDAKAQVLETLLKRRGSVYDVSSPGQPTVRP